MRKNGFIKEGIKVVLYIRAEIKGAIFIFVFNGRDPNAFVDEYKQIHLYKLVQFMQLYIEKSELLETESADVVDMRARISLVTHIVRNKLTGIGGHAKILLDRMGHTDPDRKFLEALVHSVAELEIFTTGMLGESEIG